MPITEEVLSNELRLAVEIHAAHKQKAGPVHFNMLVDRLNGRMSRGTVSRALDMLFDQGIAKAEWIRRDDGRHVRELSIAGEAKDFIAKIYEKVIEKR